MKLILGITFAFMLHLGFILFGGLLFGTNNEDKGALREVELVSDDSVTKEKEKEKEKPKEAPAEKAEEIKPTDEKPPDAAEIVRENEVSAAASAAKLEASSLSAIEAALSGKGAAAGDFAEALTFSSGGKIGGLAKPGTMDDKIDGALGLNEIDQKPRCTFNPAPTFPGDMRGKKIEGVVSVIFIVDAVGAVSSVRVERSNHPAFEKPAMEAVRRWKFEPALKGGERVACRMRVTVRFQQS